MVVKQCAFSETQGLAAGRDDAIFSNSVPLIGQKKYFSVQSEGRNLNTSDTSSRGLSALEVNFRPNIALSQLAAPGSPRIRINARIVGGLPRFSSLRFPKVHSRAKETDFVRKELDCMSTTTTRFHSASTQSFKLSNGTTVGFR